MAPVKRCDVQCYAAFEQLVVGVDMMEAAMHSDRIGCDHHQNKTLPKWSSEGLIQVMNTYSSQVYVETRMT